MTNALFYVDELPSSGVSDYFRFDTRFSWKPTDGIELSLVGQNLIDEGHQEFSAFLFQRPADIGRSVYASARFNF